MQSFPKIIHQTWKTNCIPKKWQISQTQWKKLHPDWEYKLWTDKQINQYIKDKHPQFLEIWNSFPHYIQKVDAIRYFILKDFGGIYSDLDIVPRIALDEFVDNMTVEAMFVSSANFKMVGCFTNAFMISHKGATIWDSIINELYKKSDRWWHIGKHLQVMNTTGPYMVTRVINNHDKIIGLLPAKLFNSTAVTDIESSDILHRFQLNNYNSVLINIFGSSWHEADSKIYNIVYKHFTKVISIIIIILVLQFVAKHVHFYFS